MVTVILLETGTEIEVVNSKITYNKQVADFGDITKILTSYTWGMEFIKTPNITRVFKGLGMVGDLSDFPYKKQRVSILDNGTPIVRSGLLKVKETVDGKYNAFIQDGIIDFYTDIKDSTISELVDLTDLDHVNDINTVLASFTLATYRYIISDYSGPPLPNLAGLTQLNPTSLIPSINLQYLWDRIFGELGWTYSGNFDFNAMWMTYPGAIVRSQATAITILDNFAKFILGGYPTGGLNPTTVRMQWDINTINPDYLDYFTVLDPTSFVVQQAGSYRVKFNFQGYFKYDIGIFGDLFAPVNAQLRVNGVLVGDVNSGENAEETEVTFTGYNNTLVQIMLTPLAVDGTPLQNEGVITVDQGYMIMETQGVQDISFNEALIKYKVKDFFKELLVRKGLTPFADPEAKNIHFVSLDERLDAPHVDMSAKFVRRKSESYIYESYAQSNYLRHKYDKSGQDFADGNLRVVNENLPEAKDLYTSKTYAPLELLSTFNGRVNPEYQVSNFKMFEVEVKEDPNTGDLLGDYKPLKNRFYIFESRTVVEDIVILGTLVNEFPIANINDNTFDDLVALNYSNVQRVLDNTRIHIMEMNLSAFEIANMDMTKRHFIEQEASYYLINSIKAVPGKFTEIEYVKIQRPEFQTGKTPINLNRFDSTIITFDDTNITWDNATQPNKY
tara:strand:+ start:6894 stop:8909 length:2016 start_codon:yes stop_codon:yes gene_type:complete